MKFGLKFETDCSVPRARCEVCDAEITNAGITMVYWRWEDYQQEFHQPLLVHKPCMSARRSLDEDYALSMKLSTYLAFLLQNLGLSGAKWKRAVNLAGLTSTIK
jgi:hypothetical protein